MIFLSNGRTAADVADTLLIDPDTARTYFKRYKKRGLHELFRMNIVGSEALLDAVQLAELDARLREHLYLTAESVARSINERWGVGYAPRGMAAMLRRRGYIYQKPKLLPDKADAAAQEKFLEDYETLKQCSDGGG